MKRLAELLQKHPLVVVAMFAVSAASGLMGIVLGWKQFYASYLSQSVELPVWLILLVALVGSIVFVLRPRQRPPGDAPLQTVEGQAFGVEQVALDGRRFINCTFDGSELVFRGEASFDLIGNTFNGPPRIRFERGAATTTGALRGMVKAEPFRDYVLNALELPRANG